MNNNNINNNNNNDDDDNNDIINQFTYDINNITNLINELATNIQNRSIQSDLDVLTGMNIANMFFNIANDIQNDINLNNSIDSNEDKIKIIEPSVLETFKVRKYSDLEDEKTCHITLLDFEEEQSIMELSCKHIFDEDAIRYWLSNKSNLCPVCRREFPFIYKEN
jgi:hypothetical protein